MDGSKIFCGAREWGAAEPGSAGGPGRSGPGSGPGRSRPAVWRPFFESIVVALLLAMFARTFVIQAFRIPTASMEPSLLVGDHILVGKAAFAPALGQWERRAMPLRDPVVGDVVVFRSPSDPTQTFLKRVVAVGGQRVEIDDKELLVDGRPSNPGWARFEDPRTYPDTPFLDPSYRRRDQLSSLTVPPGSLFVLGDNRDRSWDSRYWGPIPRELVIGPALVVYASIAPPGAGETPESPWWGRVRWSRTGSRVR